MQMLTAI